MSNGEGCTSEVVRLKSDYAANAIQGSIHTFAVETSQDYRGCAYLTVDCYTSMNEVVQY